MSITTTMEEIKKLSDAQLSTQLKNHSVDVGPITQTTRPLLQKKLHQLINGIHPASEMTEQKEDLPSQSSANVTKIEEKIVPPSGPQVYFAVQVPNEARSEQGTETCVLTDKKEALQLVKKYPGSRFKIFNNKDHAENYVGQCSDMVPPSPKPDLAKKKNGTQPVSEGSAFRGPKSPELVQFRRALELGNLDVIRSTVWGNPRYIISSGDTPVILQENFRYNALHVCATKNQASSAEVVLSLLQDENIFKLMYPDDSSESRQGRMTFLADLYLNTPDKGVNETPLHFACKFGHMEVVKVLVNQKATDRARVNKFGEMPKDVVCTRMRRGGAQTKAEILALLEDQVFVPLVRAVDDSTPARVIDPVSPEHLSKELKPEICNSPKDIPRVVRAMAGPMSPRQAEMFRKTWTTPPSPNIKDKAMYASIRRGDPTKGLERIGRQLAHSMHVQWNEYWTFLDAFVDLSTQEGLDVLESFLQERNEELCKELAITTQVDSLGSFLNRLDLSIGQEDSMCTPKKLVGSNIFAEYAKDRSCSFTNNTNGSPLVSNNPFMPKSLLSSSASNKIIQITNDCIKEEISAISEQCISSNQKAKIATTDTGQNDSVDDLLSAALSGLTLTSPRNDNSFKDNSYDSTDFVTNKSDTFFVQETTSHVPSAEKSGDFVPRTVDHRGTESHLSHYGNGDHHLSKPPAGNDLHSQGLKATPKSDSINKISSKNDFIVQNDDDNEDSNSLNIVKKSVKNTHENNNVKTLVVDGCEDDNSKSISDNTVTLKENKFETKSYHDESQLESDLSDDDDGSFTTATESSDPDDDLFEDSFDSPDGADDVIATPERLYLFGKEPTKTDVDVLRAIDNVKISPVSHPHVFKWKNTVTSYSEKSRTRWTNTPSKRRLSQSTPRRQHNMSLMSRSSRSTYTPSLLASPLDEDGPISFIASDSSFSDSSFSLDDSVNRIRANLIPDFLSVSNVQ